LKSISPTADALKSADNFTFVKMAVSEIAHKHGMTATFMPKPFANRAGSGAHFHVSLGSATQKNAFYDKNDKSGMGLSKMAYQFLAGRPASWRAAFCAVAAAHRQFLQAAGSWAVLCRAPRGHPLTLPTATTTVPPASAYRMVVLKSACRIPRAIPI